MYTSHRPSEDYKEFLKFSATNPVKLYFENIPGLGFKLKKKIAEHIPRPLVLEPEPGRFGTKSSAPDKKFADHAGSTTQSC